MSIQIIDTLQPLGNFPAVIAEHVQCGDLRLDVVLNASAIELAKKASKEYVDEQIATIPQPDITKSYVDTNFAKKSEIPAPVTKTSQLQNDSGFLTQHQDLSSYAKKSEIPVIPNKVSAFTNDAGYLTQHQSLADYATKEYVDSHISQGTVTSVKVGNTAYNPVSGVVSIPAYPTTLPASDVSEWAKSDTKPAYSAEEVGIPFYNVTDYGILPNAGDVWSELYDLMANTVRYTGGVVYFPEGKYTLSNTVFVPENTTFTGEGTKTEIYFDETEQYFGVGLSNAGSNVTIKNMKVTQKSTEIFRKGSQPGCIGYSNITIEQYDLEKGSQNLARGEAKNLVVENIDFGDSNYAMQTEPSVSNSVQNVIYRNLVAKRGCVSVMACGDGSPEGVQNLVMENIVCDLLRIEERAARKVGNIMVNNVICNNFYLNANHDSTAMIEVNNMTQTGLLCNNVYSSGLINGYVTFRGCSFENYIGKESGIDIGNGVHFFYNCKFKMYKKIFTRLGTLSDYDYMVIENCDFKLYSADASSLLVGYGRGNICYDMDGTNRIRNLLYGDCNRTLDQIGAVSVTSSHKNSFVLRGESLFLKVYAVCNNKNALFTLTDKAKHVPVVASRIPATTFLSTSRLTTQVETFVEITSDGVVKISDPTFPTEDYTFDRLIINAAVELEHKITPTEMYNAFA